MAPAALMFLFWRRNLLYFLLRLLISSLSPLCRSEIQTLRGLSSVLPFHGAPNYGPIQRLIYMYTHVPPKSCYWLALFFRQLLPARPCFILQLTNAPTLLQGPFSLQHGDTFLRNVKKKNHLPRDALPNTRRPET